MRPLTMLAGGDIILGEESAAYFSGIAEALKNADIRLGQLEVMYETGSINGQEMK